MQRFLPRPGLRLAGIAVVAGLLLGACNDPGTAATTPDTAAPPAPAVPGTGIDAEKTVVYRDSWGVPHIYASSVEAGLYAQGWAQAQDRPRLLLANLKMAMGEFTEIAGADGVAVSLMSTMFGHVANARVALAEIDEVGQVRMKAFANGVTDYYRAHPEDLPDWWKYREITPVMVDAFARMFLYSWSIDEAFGDLARGGIKAPLPTVSRASNQWAVSPARSASGNALLMSDPHLDWWGPSRFWEFRIHAGGLVGSGVSLAGSPYIGLGHNADIAWAITTGGPDTADIFRLTLDPDNPQRYRYDDEWRVIKQQKQRFLFPDGSEQTHQWESTDRGPVVARDDQYAYVAAVAYDEKANRFQAWEALNFAKDYRGAVAACATRGMFPLNLMVADTSGNIWYQRTGRVPVRDPALDWSRPVDGSTSATAWQGLHPATDHLQVLNPPQGYMQNCNVPPDAMMPGSPFRKDAQPSYLFSSAAYAQTSPDGTHKMLDGWINQRGARAIELLSSDNKVTVEEALAWAVDVRSFGVQRWLGALRAAAPPDSPELRDLLGWDGNIARDSTGALKYAYWRYALAGPQRADALRAVIDDYFAIVAGRAPRAVNLSDGQKLTMRTAFAAAMKQLRGDFNRTDVTWGEVFRVGRDGKDWPVGGGDGDQFGLTTLRTMTYGAPDKNHQRRAISGQTSTQVTVLSKPIQSFIYLPIGQSDRPESPHYADQAAGPYSHRQLRPSWWLPKDLADHIESRTVLNPRF